MPLPSFCSTSNGPNGLVHGRQALSKLGYVIGLEVLPFWLSKDIIAICLQG